MLRRAFSASSIVVLAVILTLAVTAPPASAGAPVEPPPVTVNPFVPEDRSISDCVSALPKPGCGSEERGGWHQYLVFVALVGGLSVIGWRIVAGVRAGNRHNLSDRAPRPATTQTAGGQPPPPATMDLPSSGNANRHQRSL